jgi:ribose/xylose/arabinose/galactoside ABC-type transport system permease subunit
VIAMATTVGLANGLLITRRNLEPVLVTLATMIMLQGIRSAATQGAPLGDTPALIRTIGRGGFAGIPFAAILLAVVVAVVTLVLNRTVLGRRIYIVGSNVRGAFLSGINPNNVRVVCYVTCSIFAGLGGIVLAGYLDQVDNWVGRGYELDSIVAAVLGGASLSGGRGTAIGALVGSGILVLLSNAILYLGVPIEFQMIMKGAIVLAAIALYARDGRRG